METLTHVYPVFSQDVIDCKYSEHLINDNWFIR